MKKRFNILCVSMFAVIILYVTGGFAYTGVITYKMVSEMMSMSKEELAKSKKNIELFDKEKYTQHAVTMIPTNIFAVKETTIENTITGEQTPVMPIKTLVFVKGTDKSMTTDIATTVTGVISITASIFFLCYLIRFIRNVRRNEIFEWKNVRMLRRMGLAIIVTFAMSVIAEWLQYAAASEVFSPKGYMTDWYSGISDHILLLGIGIAAIIIGEVFARGLQMREEQELTI